MLKKRKRLGLRRFWLLTVCIVLLTTLSIFQLHIDSRLASISISLDTRKIVDTLNEGKLVETLAIHHDLFYEPYEQLSVDVQAALGINGSFENIQALKEYDFTARNRNLLDIDVQDATSSIWTWISMLLSIFSFLLVGMLLFFFLRQTQNSKNRAILFSKNSTRLFSKQRPTVTFANVADIEKARQELQEIVEFLKYPGKFAALGAHIPRGLLLIGPPGTGKTLIAQALAGEAGVPFFSISGSEFVDMLVEVGTSRVRDLFEQAKRNSPCIIFIDEIDAIGRQHKSSLSGSHDEREQTLNQVLVEMDSFDSSTNVIVVAATNRPDILDPALLRPGRFDRQVMLDRPDIRGRIAILQVHARGKPLEKDVVLDTIARQTPGFSGADLANLLNEAAILAARRDKHTIGMSELAEATDRVQTGPARRSRIISEREKSIAAYHEMGHALVARMLRNTDPVHKVSIVARGQIGGFTILLPTEDRYLWSKPQFEDLLAYALGGHAAELIIFGEVTTGSSNDIERATEVARAMVTEYGMSERIGPVALGHKEKQGLIARTLGEQHDYSEETARAIDAEVRRIIQEAFDKAHEILLQSKTRLIMISERLIKEETLEGPVFEALFNQPLNEEQYNSPSILAGMAGTDSNSGILPRSLPQSSAPSLVWQPQIQQPRIQKPYNHDID